MYKIVANADFEFLTIIKRNECSFEACGSYVSLKTNIPDQSEGSKAKQYVVVEDVDKVKTSTEAI